MVQTEERPYFGEAGGSGVIFISPPPPPNLQMYRLPGQTRVPFPPLRELVTVCKIRSEHSIFRYKSETLNHPSYRSLLTVRWGAGGKSVLTLVLVPWQVLQLGVLCFRQTVIYYFVPTLKQNPRHPGCPWIQGR